MQRSVLKPAERVREINFIIQLYMRNIIFQLLLSLRISHQIRTLFGHILAAEEADGSRLWAGGGEIHDEGTSAAEFRTESGRSRRRRIPVLTHPWAAAEGSSERDSHKHTGASEKLVQLLQNEYTWRRTDAFNPFWTDIQVHLKKFEYEKVKGSFFFSETFMYSRVITCEVKHFKFFLAYSSWKSKVLSAEQCSFCRQRLKIFVNEPFFCDYDVDEVKLISDDKNWLNLCCAFVDKTGLKCYLRSTGY